MGHRRGARFRVFGEGVLFAVALCAAVPAAAVAHDLAYMTSSPFGEAGRLSVIDTVSGETLAVVPVSAGPSRVLTSPDGSLVYVVDDAPPYGANERRKIDVIDAATLSVVGGVALGTATPWDFALSPDGALAYIPNPGINGPGAVYFVEVSNGAFVGQVPVDRVDQVVVTPDGSTLYAKGGAGVTVIDTASQQVVATLSDFLWSGFAPLVLAPDGQTLYTACALSGDSYSTSRLCSISTQTNTVETTPPSVTGTVWALAISADGREAYVGHQNPSGYQGAVAVVDTGTGTLLTDIPVGNSPDAMAMTPDIVYVLNAGSDTISMIATATQTMVRTLPAGPGLLSIAVAPAPDGHAAPTPTPQPTRTPVPPPPTATPTMVPAPILEGDEARGLQGSDVTISITLRTGGMAIAGVQNDLEFPPQLSVVACTANANLDTTLTRFGYSPAGVRAVVVSDNLAPIPDGAVLYTCTVHIGNDAAFSWFPYELPVTHLVASDPAGNVVTITGTSAKVLILSPPTRTPTQTATPTATPTFESFPPCGAACATHRTLAYVTNFASHSVSVIDTAVPKVVATVPLPLGVAPVGVALTPDGRWVYVAMETPGAPPYVILIDTASNQVAGTIPLSSQPDSWVSSTYAIAASPDGRFVYVLDSRANALTMIDTATQTAVGHIAVGEQADGLAISPDGRRAYVTDGVVQCPASLLDGQTWCGAVQVLDLDPSSPTANSVILTWTSRSLFFPGDIAVSPDGRRVYATYDGGIAVVDATTGTFIGNANVGLQNLAIALSPDGSEAFVASEPPGALSVVDTGTDTVTARIPVNVSGPLGLAATPDGAYVYVADELAGAVQVIDVRTKALAAVVPVGLEPDAIAIGVVPVPPLGAGNNAAAPAATPTPIRCIGDCNGDGTVTVDEIVRAVAGALGNAPAAACPAFADCGACRVSSCLPGINCIVGAVNNALRGCPGG